MMKLTKLLVVIILLACLITPVLGFKLNFQDFSTSGLTVSQGVTFYSVPMGVVSLNPGNVINSQPTPFTYLALTKSSQAVRVSLYDSSMNPLLGGGGAPDIAPYVKRVEFKIDGGVPKLYFDGALVVTYPAISVNPSYVGFTYNYAYIDNMIIGELDHHITGSLPSNWSIIRDMINPAATGVYAWNPSTSTWVAKNNYNFYIDTGKESILTENLRIRHSNGVIINTSLISSTSATIEYSISQFLNTPTSLGTSIPDGLYMVYFDGTTDYYQDTFWVISQGAVVSWGNPTYPQSATGVVTYTISDLYFDTTTYDYSMDVIDVYGVVHQTTVLNAKTGIVPVTISEATYDPGVYYAEVKAVSKSDSSVHIMGIAAMEVAAYVYFTGCVMNAENTSVISGASINVSQGTAHRVSTSLTGGIWNSSSNWLTGSPISIVTTKTGYTTDINTFTPLIAKTLNITIPMMPITKSCTGVCVGGIVRDSIYGNPITGATYHVKNGTEYTATTNIAGYARVDSLISGTLYDVWSSKTGYNNSDVHQKLAVGV